MSKLLPQYFKVDYIIDTDTQNPGVEAVIEGEIPLMTLHLARSDGGVGCREEGDDQMVLPVILIGIVDGPIMGRRQREIEYFAAHQVHFLLGTGRRQGQEKETEQGQPQSIQSQFVFHDALLSFSDSR